MEIECVSAVSKVVVHARGALVTREVALPADLPAGIVDLALPGVTVAAQAGSARAALEASDRVVAAVHSSIFVPSAENRPGPSVTKLRDLAARRLRLEEEHATLTQRRTQLAAVELAPEIHTHDGKRPRDAFDVRFGEALAMSRLLAAKVVDLDERILWLEKDLRDVGRTMEAARLEDQQTSTRERMGTQHPTRRITVRMTGEGKPGRLLVTYAVSAARWWPTYTLRILDGGASATWTFEALVAQRTGEDWTAALLALSSADLVFDARLPELASLRFGRAQPPKRRPLRAAPAGVNDMFAAYLAFRPGTTPPASAASQVAYSEDADMDEQTAVTDRAKKVEAPSPPPHARGYAGPPPGGAGGGGPPPGAPPIPMATPMQAQAMSAAPRPQAMMMKARMAGDGAMRSAAPPKGGMLGGMFGGSSEAGLYDDGASGQASEPELVLGEQWSDLDALVLAGGDDARRGKLVPRPSAFDRGAVAHAVSQIDSVAKDRWIDPGESRGMFDHRYEATGRADVPSDGRVHRVGVTSSPCNVLIAWRTVPSESPEVYREANVINPFDTALLGGPVDVYLDGSLLAETKTDRIDRGGTIWCGMGVDDRVKVARNVRADEESAGLLGGSLAVTNSVSIELSSVIKDPIKVVVLERVPVTDDKTIEIKVLKALPQPASYDQAERGAAVRGGLRFEAIVSAGKKTTLEVVYKLVFASKLDIVGGSRRG